MNWRAAWDTIKQTAREFSEDKCPRLGAALAFYTALSIAPLVLLVVSIAGLVFDEQAASGRLQEQLKDLIGAEGAKTVEELVAKSAQHGHGVLATVVGVVTLLIGATGVFAQLQDALDTVWNVKTDTSASGIWATVKDRLLSFSMICGMAFLLMVSLVFSAILSGLGSVFDQWLPYSSVWMRLGNAVLSLLLTTLMFAMIFKLLPHARPAWRDVWVGAALTAVLFNVGKYLIGLYLGQAAPGSAYGAAGSFVVLLFWIYYSTQIVLFGAEFTQVYALKFGSGLRSVAGLAPADPNNPTGAGATAAAGPVATAEPVI
jgi:membrane protein